MCGLFSNAPLEVQEAAGQLQDQGLDRSFSYGYNDLDDVRKPTDGVSLSLSQSFAGFGGSLKYVETGIGLASYAAMFDGAMIGSFSFKGRMITGYDGSFVPFEEQSSSTAATPSAASPWPASARARPRRRPTPARWAARWTPSAPFALRFPGTAAGKLWHQHAGLFTLISAPWAIWTISRRPQRVCTGPLQSGVGTCIKDNLAFRASAGISVQWKSPFGPVQIDLGLPFVKTKY